MTTAEKHRTQRRLVVNADDFGFTPDVNRGIIEAYQRGILRATTLMANGEAFEDAVRLARENPGLDVGCHLALVQGRSVLAGRSPLPATVSELVWAVALRRISVYEELAAQVRRVLEAGLNPTHLDTHKHTHLLPPVLAAVARIAAEFRIRWVRRPLDFPGALPAPWPMRAVSRGLSLLRGRFEAVLELHGCRATDHFTGFQLTGRLKTGELAQILQNLPAGTTELMCHPGHCGPELRRAQTRLKESREAELEALTAPETWDTVRAAGIRLVSFREL